MSDLTYFFAIIGVILIACIFCLIVIAIKDNRTYKQQMIRISQYSVNIQATIDDSIQDLLTSIINECFEDYKLLVLYPKNENYITDAREEEIRKDLVNKVAERISPMSLDKLSLRYNLDNIDMVIADKIYIIVTNYVVETNSVKDDMRELA